MLRPMPDPIKPGQVSVWNYPRPSIIEHIQAHLRVEYFGLVIAETRSGFRSLETSHPPSYYFPPDAVSQQYLRNSSRNTKCEWKGAADYYDLIIEDRVIHNAAWSYPTPENSFAAIKDYIAFYAGKVDACFVDGERVIPQTGQFYGGWITSALAGPFKGSPGTEGW